jgi:serpin B
MKKIIIAIVLPFLCCFLHCEEKPMKEYFSIAEANNKFTFDFYSQLNHKQNLFFSPASIISAFGMAYEGADGKTAKEIKSVFCFPDDETRHNSFQVLSTLLNKKDANCNLSIANAFWVQKNFQLLDSYIKTLTHYYNGESYNLDFITQPEQAVKKINQWAEKKTNDKIKNLLNISDINQMTRIILTNAVYFKGIWQFQFDKKATVEDDFKVNKNKTIKVKMMQLLNKEFPYTEDENFQVIKIPYACKNLSMIIVLPKENEVEKNQLDFRYFTRLQKNLNLQKVDIFVPKFKIESTYDLIPPLKNLGITTAFTPLADFSKITGNNDLFISKAIQKTYVDVNEEGTEAAAVTGIVMNVTAVRPETKKIFRADHPFLFFIIEENSSIILFAGKVTEP